MSAQSSQIESNVISRVPKKTSRVPRAPKAPAPKRRREPKPSRKMVKCTYPECMRHVDHERLALGERTCYVHDAELMDFRKRYNQSIVPACTVANCKTYPLYIEYWTNHRYCGKHKPEDSSCWHEITASKPWICQKDGCDSTLTACHLDEYTGLHYCQLCATPTCLIVEQTMELKYCTHEDGCDVPIRSDALRKFCQEHNPDNPKFQHKGLAAPAGCCYKCIKPASHGFKFGSEPMYCKYHAPDGMVDVNQPDISDFELSLKSMMETSTLVEDDDVIFVPSNKPIELIDLTKSDSKITSEFYNPELLAALGLELSDL